MNTFLVLSAMLAVAYGVSDSFMQDMKAKVMDVSAVCVPETGANEADIAELMENKEPTRKEGKCLLSCFFKKFGLQAENGKPDKMKTMAMLEPLHDDDPDMYTKVMQVSMKCAPEVESMGIKDHCNIAVEIGKCALREGEALGLKDPFMLSR